MDTRYRKHDLRRTTDLRGMWDFAFLGDVEPDDVDPPSIGFADVMGVPGCFDATPRYAGKRGLAAYRRRVLLRDDKPHRLILDGLHHWGRVFLNGRRLRDHVGGFTRFATDIVGHQPGEADVVLLVDNRFHYERCPIHLPYFDWYHFGGLARGAELHALGDLWIDHAIVATTDYAARRLAVTVQYGATAPPGEVELAIECAGQTFRSRHDLKDPSGRIRVELELPGAAGLWSPDEPVLHMLHIRLGDDDLRERIGIRQVAADGRNITINGQPVRLLGFCRHESHPQFGHGLPDALIAADVQQLTDMGCNFVRGSHYPQDGRFLDLCDERGLCVWCETIGWQQTAEHLNDEHFMAAQLAQVDEMVAAAINHPSVILWGVLNEAFSDQAECVAGYKRLLGRVRELDATRPVTYASCRPFGDLCFDLADVISINTYPGWYGGEIEEIPARLDEIAAHLEKVGQGSKPLIISEIGAGALPGWRDWNEARWSEQYQARLLEEVISHMFFDRNRFAGLSIWQYCDMRTSSDARPAMGRPRSFNNKGVMDEYRRPKMAYDTVRTQFREIRRRSREPLV